MVQSLREPSEVSVKAPFLVPTSTLTPAMVILSYGPVAVDRRVPHPSAVTVLPDRYDDFASVEHAAPRAGSARAG